MEPISHFKKTLSITISLALALMCLPSIQLIAPTTARADESITASGSCGNTANWQLSSSGLLKISGQGTADRCSSWNSYKSNITSVEVEEGITSLGSEAFRGCVNLTTANLPKSLLNIEDYAFFNCTSLSNITLPAGLSNIGDYAFSYCSKIGITKLPDKLKTVGHHAFEYCTNIEEITIPGSTTTGVYAFASCSNLKKAVINIGVSTIPSGCFDHCLKLETVQLPEGIETIDTNAFGYCKSLSTINFPTSLKSVAESAFTCGTGYDTNKYCPFLLQHYGLASISKNVYWWLSDQTYILLASGELLILGDGDFTSSYTNNVAIGNLASSVKIYPGITRIQSLSFKNAKSIEIPNTIRSIGYYCFSGCASLETITIPDSVTSIVDTAFNGCTSLKEIHVSSRETYKLAMAACPSTCKVVWPDKPPMPSMSFASSTVETKYGSPIVNKLTYSGNGAVAYSSSNSSVATVASDGTVTATGVGTCTITAKATETEAYEAATASYTLTVTKASQTMTLPTNNAELVVGDTLSLAATANTDISYASSNYRVANVSSKGVVTAESAGTCTITATAAQSSKYEQTSVTCDITVINPGSKEASMSFTLPALNTAYGETVINKLTYTGDGTVTYSSSNNQIATVAADGTVTPIAVGTCTITAGAPATKKYKAASTSYTLTVEQASQTVSFPQDSIAINMGETATLTATAKTTIDYRSSDTSIATVSSNGIVTALKPGICTITATAVQTQNYAKASAKCRVTVNASGNILSFANDKITFSAADASTRNVLTCTIDITPIYSSSNEAVATVNSGTGDLTLVSAGTCVITATVPATNYSPAASASYELTVIKATPHITTTSSNYSLKKGSTAQLNLKSSSPGNVLFTSSDTNIVTVSSSGELKAVGAGAAVVTAAIKSTPLYDSGTATITVNVVDAPNTTTAKVKKTKLSSVKPVSYRGNYGFKISFKKVSKATGYILQASTSKSFKKAKTVKKRSSYYTKQRKLLGYNYGWNLTTKRNKLYYIRVCAYKILKGKTVRGAWSPAVKSRTK